MPRAVPQEKSSEKPHENQLAKHQWRLRHPASPPQWRTSRWYPLVRNRSCGENGLDESHLIQFPSGMSMDVMQQFSAKSCELWSPEASWIAGEGKKNISDQASNRPPCSRCFCGSPRGRSDSRFVHGLPSYPATLPQEIFTISCWYVGCSGPEIHVLNDFNGHKLAAYFTTNPFHGTDSG